MFKLCPRCGITKNLGEFNHNHRQLDGLQSYCRACQAAWYKLHREQVCEQKRDAYKQNPSKRRESMKTYAATHREQINARQRARRAAAKASGAAS